MLDAVAELPDTTPPDVAPEPLTETLFHEAAAATGAEKKRILNRIVVKHLELAESIARRYRGSLDDSSDLTQVACLGLIKAVHHFEPSRGGAFIPYAIPTIAGEIKRYLRDHGWVIRPPRKIQDLRSAIGKVLPQLSQQLGKDPAPSELARELGVPEAEVIEAIGSTNSLHPLSIDVVREGDGQSMSDTIAAEFDGLDRAELHIILVSALRCLSDRERQIVYLRFFEDCTQQQIADEIGVSQMHVSRLLLHVVNLLRAELLVGNAATSLARQRAREAEAVERGRNAA